MASADARSRPVLAVVYVRMTGPGRWFNLSFLDEAAPNADIFIRLLVGAHLIIGTQDNVFAWARMLEFGDFLAARHVPFPLFAAVLSAYAQFVCGILYVLGLFTREAAIVMIVNFCAALVIAHIGVPYAATFPALVMLFGSIYLLVHGAGALSLDHLRRRSDAVSER